MLKRALFYVLILLNIFFLSGCWNYRELNDIDIAAGAAVDKNKDNNNYMVTVEIINAKGGKDGSITPDIMNMEGITIFDAIRNMIMRIGRRIYWGHSRVFIISQDIAREGVIDVIDFINRDAEARADTYLLISQEETAGELLKGKDKVHDTISFHIVDTMKSQKSIPSYAVVELWQFIKDLSAEGISATIPTAIMAKDKDSITPQVTGTAVFKKDKMIGWLDDTESRSMLFIKGKINSGLIIIPNIMENTNATLELSKVTTKVTPVIKEGNLTMNIKVVIDAGIAEVQGDTDIISKDGRKKVIEVAEKTVKSQLESVIKKVQSQYKSDVFGFGSTVQRKMPNEWKAIKDDWGNIFADMDTNVSVKVEIKGSALASKPIKVGD
ncbi:spore germination protein B3 precursor [Oxobacter pfennigii]|uniref:Spore germination protein B3 n=1 Tax=Oxobacter pfennigii TaxID=36849 RepID=A0A0P8Z006_9CLOT|nr:spore germination protein B3 precursor [Oxobacter pfennigii]